MVVVVGLLGALCATIATAAVTSPTNGALYRGGTVPITESVGARRLLNDGSEIPSFTSNAACSTRDQANTPLSSIGHTLVKIFGPGQDPNTATPLFTQPSPWRHVANTIAGPAYDRGGPFSFTWAIPDDAAPGIYTVVSTVTDRKRTQTTGITLNTTLAACAQQPPVSTQTTFEYRPWSEKFKDVFGNGDVSFNLSPPEFQATVLGKSTPITDGGGTRIRTFAVSDPTAFAFPEDPTPCAEDPASCLPAGVTECKPAGNPDCDARFVVIRWIESANRNVNGLFDLDSRAFLAVVNYDGNRAVMASLGTDGDAALADLLAQIAALAAEQGIDMMSLLATRVKVTIDTGAKSQVVAVSLLRALQIYSESPGGPTGISIEAPLTATVGLFAHSYSFKDAPNPTGVASDVRACSTVRSATQSNPGKCFSALSQPASATQFVGRFTPKSGLGYNVLKSDLLPDLPKLTTPALPPIPGVPVDPLTMAIVLATVQGAPNLVPTKFFNIHGTWPTGAHQTRIGVDTSPGEPHGLPVWVQPFSTLGTPDPAAIAANPTGSALALALGILGASATFKDTAMDFLGTAAWATSETCTATLCSGSGSMTGLGVGIFTKAPLPIGFRNIPIWDPQSPEVVALMAAVNQAISDGNAAANEQIAALLADPTIQMVLEAIFGSLPALPGLPETPDLPV